MKIFSSILFFLWTIFIIFLYYSTNESHKALIETKGNEVLIFTGIILTGYIIFKGIEIFLEKKESSYSFWSIIGAFFLELFFVCILYANFIVNTSWSSPEWLSNNPFLLFFHVIFFLIYPIFLVFLWKAIGGSILHFKNFSQKWNEFPLRFRAIIETALGLWILSFFLFLLGIFGGYNFTNLIVLLGWLSIFSYIGWKQIFTEIRNTKIIFSHSTPFSLRSISAEISFLVFGFIASVSLISVLRPMPIGWDDLGVYMNFPKIIANTGNMLEGAGMYIWHLITGTGFLFSNSATQAFFINQIWGFLATIAIISSISLLTENKNISKKSSILLCLPMVFGVIYYLMPMTIFQQAKDMKLDPALMFVSISAILALLFGIQKYNSLKNFWKILIFIAGILAGFAFGIKFTSLMLLISAFGFISYKILGIWGFFGFFGIFINIFTIFKLWSQMFVWMPENSLPILIFGTICIIFWFGSSLYKNFWKIFDYFTISVIFGLGIFLSIFPWILKNLTEIPTWQLSVSSLLNGKNTYVFNDVSTLYTPEEFSIRKQNHEGTMITEDGTSLNEDFNRYFGQEKWLSNYIKLPANLTMQANQKGEFTDITYIFLALVPVTLLFARTKNPKKHIIWIGGICIFLFLSIFTFGNIFEKFPKSSIFSSPDFFNTITIFFEKIPLIWAYFILIALVSAFLFLVEFCLKDDDENNHLKSILFFTALYGLIFWVSSFWIVWYGVVIYFFFLIIIVLCLNSFNTISHTDDEDTIFTKHIVIIITIITLIPYMTLSIFSHGVNNLKNANYDIYKFFGTSQDTTIFMYKQEYFTPILELNVKNPNHITQEIIEKIQNSSIKNILKQIPENTITAKNLPKILQSLIFSIQQENHQLSKLPNSPQKTTKISENKKLLIDTENILDDLYQKILYPSPENLNNLGIYRVGTFMSYFIQNNRSRFFDDSLINEFQVMLYDENSNTTLDRMEKIGLKYFLIDLNAATIDRDERHALTTRFENLLTTIRNPRLELIDTDNICLRIAIDEYHDGKLQNPRDFLDIAGTNYESYINDVRILRQHKQQNCLDYIVKEKIYEKYDYIKNIIPTDSTDEDVKISLSEIIRQQTFFALFKFKEQ